MSDPAGTLRASWPAAGAVLLPAAGALDVRQAVRTALAETEQHLAALHRLVRCGQLEAGTPRLQQLDALVQALVDAELVMSDALLPIEHVTPRHG